MPRYMVAHKITGPLITGHRSLKEAKKSAKKCKGVCNVYEFIDKTLRWRRV